MAKICCLPLNRVSGYMVVNGYNATYGRAAEDANRCFVRNITKILGDEEVPREFIALDNGLYKQNPAYARGANKIHKRIGQHPNETQQALANMLWELWLASDAPTPDQRSLLRSSLLDDRRWPTLREYSFYYNSAAEDAHDWDGKGARFKTVSPEQFRKLGRQGV